MDYDKIGRELDSLLLDFYNNENIDKIFDKLDISKSDYDKGIGYYQHNINNVLKYKKILVKIVSELTKHPILLKYEPEKIHPMGIVGKIIDNTGNKFLICRWGKLCRIDETGKEWGSSYYAINPPKGENINLTFIINPIFRKQKIKKILEGYGSL